jgi:hypothetical protein
VVLNKIVFGNKLRIRMRKIKGSFISMLLIPVSSMTNTKGRKMPQLIGKI